MQPQTEHVIQIDDRGSYGPEVAPSLLPPGRLAPTDRQRGEGGSIRAEERAFIDLGLLAEYNVIVWGVEHVLQSLGLA